VCKGHELELGIVYKKTPPPISKGYIAKTEPVSNDEEASQLHQLAHLVIDAYLAPRDTFVPAFAENEEAVLYLAHTETNDGSPGREGHDKPRLNFWYHKSEY
jgi:hypothetical protein